MTTWTTPSGRTYTRVGGKTYVIGGAGAVSSAAVAADAAARQQATRLANVARAQQVTAQRAAGASGADLTRYQSQQAALGKEVTAVQAGTTTEAIRTAARNAANYKRQLEEEAARVAAEKARLKTQNLCPRGDWYNINFTQSCDPGYEKKYENTRKLFYCKCMTAPPQTPSTPEDATTPTAGCPEGLFYDATWYQKCKEGYIEYSIKGHNKCICSARLAEAKAQLDSLYVGENGNGDGDGIFAELGDLGKVTEYIPVVILGAIVVAAIGMFKK